MNGVHSDDVSQGRSDNEVKLSMRFYKEIIDKEDGSLLRQHQYHEWSEQSIQHFWNLWTSNSFLQRQFYPAEYWQDLLAWADQRLSRKPLLVADIGCGGGNLLDRLLKCYRDASIVGVDLTPESLEAPAKRFKSETRVSFAVGSLDRLPFDRETVDLITCTEVLEHTFPEVFKKSFTEVGRVLRVGGHYLASVPFFEKISFVCCPECQRLFTPYQHMNFEITHDDIIRELSANRLELVAFFTPSDQSVDRSRPDGALKRLIKPIVLQHFPQLANRLFPKAGVTGFLARKVSA
jgi:ubiquinone/menaquinone biosynthesis C-methylase UbiE